MALRCGHYAVLLSGGEDKGMLTGFVGCGGSGADVCYYRWSIGAPHPAGAQNYYPSPERRASDL